MQDFNNNLRREVREHLKSLSRAGLRHLPPSSAQPSAPATGPDDAISLASPSDAAAVPIRVSPLQSSAGGCGDAWRSLRANVAACVRCRELAETRTQTVFGVGNTSAEILFIGEAPGADEDRKGEPFVGAAGQLLNKIIEACHWRREDIYICNILKCRPPGNRVPSRVEAANCREYLQEQLQLVDPSYIVCWGTVAAQNLLDSTTSIGRLRGKFYVYGRAKVLCTYHPSYLLRNPAAKKDVWDDMKLLMAEMERQ